MLILVRFFFLLISPTPPRTRQLENHQAAANMVKIIHRSKVGKMLVFIGHIFPGRKAPFTVDNQDRSIQINKLNPFNFNIRI